MWGWWGTKNQKIISFWSREGGEWECDGLRGDWVDEGRVRGVLVELEVSRWRREREVVMGDVLGEGERKND